MDSVEPKEQRPLLKNERTLLGVRRQSKIQEISANWVVGGSEVNCQLLFRSTRLKPSDFIWMDSVEPKEQRPLLKNERTLLGVQRQSSHYSGKSSIGVGWSVGQNKSFSKNSETNFPIHSNELGVSCQEMKNLGPKMSEWCCRCDSNPIIIQGKAQ